MKMYYLVWRGHIAAPGPLFAVRLRATFSCLLVVLWLAGCASSTLAPPQTGAQTGAPNLAGTAAPIAATQRTLQLATRLLDEPPVLPALSAELDALCNYLTQSNGLGQDNRSQEALRECKRQQQAAMNARRLACAQRNTASSPLQRTAQIEACTRNERDFAQALQDRTDFDRFPAISSLEEYSSLRRRLAAEGDRMGLQAEIGVRMNALCARQAPVFSTTAEWRTALALFEAAGPGGACAAHAGVATAALLDIAKAEERAVLAQSTSWKLLVDFEQSYAQNDPAGLLPEARIRLDRARERELASMRGLSMDTLERFWRNGAGQTPEMQAASRTRLLDESLRERSFAGGLRAFRVTGDLSYVVSHQSLARTPTERRQLEEIAVARTATPGRFFSVSVSASHGAAERDETRHAGYLALYTMTGTIPAEAVVTVQRAVTAPGPLALGRYRVHVQAELRARVALQRRSGIQGNENSTNEQVYRQRTSVVVGAPSMTGSVGIKFGDITAVRMKRGAAGGFEHEAIDGDPVIVVTVVGVDVLEGEP